MSFTPTDLLWMGGVLAVAIGLFAYLRKQSTPKATGKREYKSKPPSSENISSKAKGWLLRLLKSEDNEGWRAKFRKWIDKWWRAIIALIIIEILVAVTFPHWFSVLAKNPWFWVDHLLVFAAFAILSKPDPLKKDFKLSTAGGWVIFFLVVANVWLIWINWPYWTFTDEPVTAEARGQEKWYAGLSPFDWFETKPSVVEEKLRWADIVSGKPGTTVEVVAPVNQFVKVSVGTGGFNAHRFSGCVYGYTNGRSRFYQCPGQLAPPVKVKWIAYMAASQTTPVTFKVTFK